MVSINAHAAERALRYLEAIIENQRPAVVRAAEKFKARTNLGDLNEKFNTYTYKETLAENIGPKKARKYEIYEDTNKTTNEIICSNKYEMLMENYNEWIEITHKKNKRIKTLEREKINTNKNLFNANRIITGEGPNLKITFKNVSIVENVTKQTQTYSMLTKWKTKA